MTWNSPRTWGPGDLVTSALLNEQLRDNLKAIGDPWTAYVPLWTAAGDDPVLGDGACSGAFVQAGSLVLFRAAVTMGSTTTYGTGRWRLTLPVPPVAHLWVFAAELRDAAKLSHPGRAVWAGADTVELFCPSKKRGRPDRGVRAGVPFAWGPGDVVAVSGVYEAA